MRHRVALVIVLIFTALVVLFVWLNASKQLVYTARVRNGICYAAYSSSLNGIVCVCHDGTVVIYNSDLSRVVHESKLSNRRIRSACIRNNMIYFLSDNGLDRVEIGKDLTFSRMLLSEKQYDNVHVDVECKYAILNFGILCCVLDLTTSRVILDKTVADGGVLFDSNHDLFTVCSLLDSKCFIVSMKKWTDELAYHITETVTAMHVNQQGQVYLFTEHCNVFVDGSKDVNMSSLLMQASPGCVVTKSLAFDDSKIVIGHENGAVAIVDIFHNRLVELDVGFTSRVIGISKLPGRNACLAWSHANGNDDSTGNAMIVVIDNLIR